MVYYGKGFTWSELYDMPVWLRKFYYKKTHDAIQEQKKSEKKIDKRKPKIANPGKIHSSAKNFKK